MPEVLRIARRRAGIYKCVSLNLSLNGSLLTPFLTPLTLQIFVLFFLVLDLTSYSLLHASYVLGLCHCVFY